MKKKVFKEGLLAGARRTVDLINATWFETAFQGKVKRWETSFEGVLGSDLRKRYSDVHRVWSLVEKVAVVVVVNFRFLFVFYFISFQFRFGR